MDKRFYLCKKPHVFQILLKKVINIEREPFQKEGQHTGLSELWRRYLKNAWVIAKGELIREKISKKKDIQVFQLR